MRVRDLTRKSVLEFRGPVFPIDVTGQEVQCLFLLSELSEYSECKNKVMSRSGHLCQGRIAN